jgi:oligoendopeptidase F
VKRTLLLGVCALLLASGARPAGELATLEQTLSRKERKLSALYAEFWREQYRVALGERDASTLAIRERIGGVLTEPTFLKELERASFPDRVVERRRKFFLEEAADSRISSDPRLSALVEELEKDYTAARFRVGGEEVTRAELNTIVAQDLDRARRKAAWEARAQMAAIAADRVRHAIVLRQELSRRYAGEPFPDFMLRRNQVDRVKMMGWFEEIRRDTEAEFLRLSARMKKELSVEVLEPWDIEHFFAKLSGPNLDQALSREKAWPRTKALSRAMGWDLARLPVTLKVADIAFGGGTYPILYGREVRMLVNTYDGLTFTDTLLHEAGHALHYCFDDEGSFLLKSSYAQPFDEGLGQTISLLLYRPEVGIKFFGLTKAQVAAIAEAYRLGSLFDLRQRIASSLFEFEAYADPDRLFQKYVGVSTHGLPVWAYNPFYATGPIYLQSYVLAEMVGRQIHDAIDRRFGRTWGPAAGSYLRERFFSRGGRLTLDEILVEGTGQPLSASALTAALSSSP